MIIDNEAITKIISGAPVTGGIVNSAAGAGSMDWIGRINEVVTGINKLMDSYKEMKGIITPNNESRFKMNESVKPVTTVAPVNSSANDLIPGVIKILETLEKLGYGDTPIGKVISELPYPVKIVKGMVQNYASKSR
jgi:hypothetical protein